MSVTYVSQPPQLLSAAFAQMWDIFDYHCGLRLIESRKY